MISDNEKNTRIQNFGRSDKKAYDKYDQKGKDEKKNEEDHLEQVFDERTKVIRRECFKCKSKLNLSASNIDDFDSLVTSIYLNENHFLLESLHLGNNRFTEEGFIDILSSLQAHNFTLREIYLGNNNLGALGIDAFLEMLPIFVRLETLSLPNVGLEDEDVVAICKIMPYLKNLKTLTISSNEIGDIGFVALAIVAVSENCNLTTLHVGQNQPSTEALSHFIDSLKENKTIKTLYLNDILFENDAVEALEKLLRKNKVIENLNLGNCAFDDESIEILKDALSKNKQLKALHLWGNRVTDKGANILYTLLDKFNSALTTMTLSDNKIEDDDIIDEIQDLLRQNKLIANVDKPKPISQNNGNTNENQQDDDDNVTTPDEERDEMEFFGLEKELNQIEKENKEQRKKAKKEGKSKNDGKIWKGFIEDKENGLLRSEFDED